MAASSAARLLLLLQLLLASLLVPLVARPFVERPAGLARDLVLVIDASACMQATDVVAEPPRGGQARPPSRRSRTCPRAAR